MNRLILEPADFISEDLVLIEGPRAEHLRTVCKLGPGNPIKLGVLNGPLADGEVIESSVNGLKIKYLHNLTTEQSNLGEVSVCLALPRPQMLKRIFQKSATFGVKLLVLFRSERVEKSYFGSPLLSSEEIKRNLILGLEQGGGTRLPQVIIFRLEGEFNEWRKGQDPAGRFLLSLNTKNNILGHSREALRRASFIIGPEGGFIPKEEERFLLEGFKPIKVSESILRVESAFDFILAQHTLMNLETVNNG